MKDFGQKIWFDKGRYSLPLPWKQDIRIKIPDNYAQCIKRVLSLWKRLKTKPENLKTYDDIIKQQEKDGIIERCVTDPADGKVHYLPHHCVIREDKETSKLRIVHDASANKPSLNSCLEKGPCLLPLLIEVLLRFRTYKVVLLGDIKQAYLNISVDEKDRDYMRFVWLEDVYADEPLIIVYRFCRVFFGMISAQFLLLLVIQIHLEKYEGTDKWLITHILLSLYVDDYTGGAADIKTAFEMYKRIKEIFQAAGLELRKWKTNNAELRTKLDQVEGGSSPPEESTPGNEKVLGIQRDPSIDMLYTKTGKLYDENKDRRVTKRNVLKTEASIYDPLGMVAPITIRIKVFFQKITKKKYGWDDDLNSELVEEWEDLLKLLAKDDVGETERYYFDKYQISDLKKVVVHGFCDASKDAYAAVVYVVGVGVGDAVSKLVMCKTKVSPLKEMTIPKLELCGCLLLAMMIKCVKKFIQ